MILTRSLPITIPLLTYWIIPLLYICHSPHSLQKHRHNQCLPPKPLPSYTLHPMAYPSSQKVCFFSKKQIENLAIDTIYTIEVLKEKGGMHENIDFSVLTPNNSLEVRDNWHTYNDQRTLPALNELIKKAHYVNGRYYSFENNLLESEGGEGYGNMCYDIYTYTYDSTTGKISSATTVMECKFGSLTREKRIYYDTIGRVQYKVMEPEYTAENDTLIESTSKATYDTTYYEYDVKGLLKGWKAHKTDTLSSLFNTNLPENTNITYHQCYVNKQKFEQFIDKQIGYRPTFVLFEIYKNAVFVFRYDPRKKKYYQNPDIHLE
jgi:hypothetical protein